MTETDTPGLDGPIHFGRMADDSLRLILDEKGRYVASVQIHQTPRTMGLLDEERRLRAADRILLTWNCHGDLLDACKKAFNDLASTEGGDWQVAQLTLREAITKADSL